MELVHAVTYFAEESITAARASGLRGFWMGYFGFRAAPLGEVDAHDVGEAFYNFAPSMVERAVPDAWRFATPAALLEARAGSAARALRRLSAPAEKLAANVHDVLHDAIRRPPSSMESSLFEANRALPRRADPVEELWQQCTTLREHRGDGHVAALRDYRIDGCEAHILFAADRGVDESVLRDSRGWSPEIWLTSAAGLTTRGLLDAKGALTPQGLAVRRGVEAKTDSVAAAAWATAPSSTVADLIQEFEAIARTIAVEGPIPFPNPMGLPQPVF